MASILKPGFSTEEVGFYRKHLVEGGLDDPTGGRQKRLASAMRRARREPLSPVWVSSLATHAADDVAQRIRDILAAESALVPASSLYGYLLTRRAARLDEISGDVTSTWGPAVSSVSGRAADVLEAHNPLKECGARKGLVEGGEQDGDMQEHIGARLAA